MTLSNTSRSYGTVARGLHWLTAGLILTAIPLGLYANSLPFDTSEALAAKARVFYLHKTLGIAAFFAALLRVGWALGQPRPLPLHPARRLETWLAEAVHWSLYIAILAVPLSGWIHHAATTGFAPILWPFGDDLPLVPKSPHLAELAASAHWVLNKILAASIALHVAGALKHALIDRDATLARMTRGAIAGPATDTAHRARGATLAAVAAFGLGTGLAVALTPSSPPAPAAEATAAIPAASGNWQVSSGTLSFEVVQMGAPVTGQFASWQADIRFDPEASSGNRVEVTIDTTSLALGSVTEQAKGADFFDVSAHPSARFAAEITDASAGYLATGTLTLRGVTLPVTLPFSLTIEGDTARMTGQTTLDRRDFGIGASFSDEGSVGFSVIVTVDLTATRLE